MVLEHQGGQHQPATAGDTAASLCACPNCARLEAELAQLRACNGILKSRCVRLAQENTSQRQLLAGYKDEVAASTAILRTVVKRTRRPLRETIAAVIKKLKESTPDANLPQA